MYNISNTEYLKSLNANKIIDRLWQGSYPYSMDAVKENFDVLVLCADELQMTYNDILLDEHYPSITIIRCGLDDSIPVRAGDFKKANNASKKIAIEYNLGKQILITCAAGLNRSGLITALVLRLISDMSGSDASKLIKNARHGALYNTAFDAYICSLDKL